MTFHTMSCRPAVNKTINQESTGHMCHLFAQLLSYDAHITEIIASTLANTWWCHAVAGAYITLTTLCSTVILHTCLGHKLKSIRSSAVRMEASLYQVLKLRDDLLLKLRFRLCHTVLSVAYAGTLLHWNGRNQAPDRAVSRATT